jgi:glycine cleavage system transcriptional repressor
MPKNLVLTLTGRDRVGLVDRVTEVVHNNGGNIEASRMARLGDEFAVLMLVSVPEDRVADLEQDSQQLSTEGFAVSCRPTEQTDPSQYAGWVPHEVAVTGADHEGIIHRITHRLAELKVNIESMDTGTVTASMSGTPLFTMSAIVLAPPDLPRRKLAGYLEAVGDELNVDVDVTPYTGTGD